MDQSIGLPQVVEELVAEPLAQVGARNEAGDVDQFNRHASLTILARAVVGRTLRFQPKSGTRAGHLQVAYCPLRVDGRESAERSLIKQCTKARVGSAREISYNRLTWNANYLPDIDAPTLELASVRLCTG